MTDSELWSSWTVWMAVAGVVVLAAAGLLITIWLTARGIRKHAARALAAGEEIRRNTQAVWELRITNETAGDLLAAVESLEGKASALAEALADPVLARQAAGRRPG